VPPSWADPAPIALSIALRFSSPSSSKNLNYGLWDPSFAISANSSVQQAPALQGITMSVNEFSPKLPGLDWSLLDCFNPVASTWIYSDLGS